MSNKMGFKSMERASNSYASSTIAKCNTKSGQSSGGSATHKQTDYDKSRRILECHIWSKLDGFSPKKPISKVHKTTKEIMMLVETYCRFRSSPCSGHGSKSSHTQRTSASQSKSASKSMSSSKLPSAAKCYTGVIDLNTTKKSSTTTNRFNVTNVQLQQELKGLSDSDGFVKLLPARWKRASKSVERYSVDHPDENKGRRSSRHCRTIERPVAANDIHRIKTIVALKEQNTIQAKTQSTWKIGGHNVFYK